ncbi:hypothetical protein TRICI_004029 [Trichomonascus ciferrii]|uniref:Protein MON2 homolog n=1 Tax=Trichomonascus ciferrii TaxID=44093 RepID=A0A642V235_9ASCO|nr:hypothetical protein TRICI_004029 [Trichomonascus ciferrii]
MINMKGLPTDQLDKVLEAFKEATNLGVEIQLKILQSLPSIIQNYGPYMFDGLISDLLHICSILQGSNKVGVVMNTAAASMQQLILAVFEKVGNEDDVGDEGLKTFDASIENNQKVQIRPAAHDALRIFYDLCNITERQKPGFLKFHHLPETFSLELFESILTYHSQLFHTHVELAYVLRTRVAPMLLRSFAEKKDFPVTVRVTRVLYLLIRRQLPVLKVECEVILSVLTHALEPKSSPYWKRLLAIEVFQGTCSEYSLVQDIYQEYDNEDDRRDIIHDLITTLDRISSENPEMIGAGAYSIPFTMPTGPDGEPLDLESSKPHMDINKIPGISVRTSSVRVACVDLLDKSEPPALPESYLYYLILSCLNSLSEGLAKFVLSTSKLGSNLPSANISDTSLSRPASAQGTVGSKSIVSENTPDSPKDVGDNSMTVTSSLVEKCWPEILSLYTTFFHATMDTECYHLLVRSAQKFTHASGALSLVSPRDSFLSLLGKLSVLRPTVDKNENGGRNSSSSKNLLSVETIVGSIGSSISGHHSRSASTSGSSGATAGAATPASPSKPVAANGRGDLLVVGTLTSRNILCCRALLNLGIYLGSSLGRSWNVIIETLQAVDSILNSESKGNRSRTALGLQLFSHLGSDYSSIDGSFKKMLESTKEYSEPSFIDLVMSICTISSMTVGVNMASENISVHDGIAGIGSPERADPFLLLDLLGEVSLINISRFVAEDASPKSWEYIIKYLETVMISREVVSDARVRAAQILNEIDLQACLQTTMLQANEKWVSEIQRMVLSSFRHSVGRIVKKGLPEEESVNLVATESEIHVSMIDNLNKMLDQCGGRLLNGWDIVLETIDTVFNWSTNKADLQSSNPRVKDRSTRLVKTGFESLQLICTDFLLYLPTDCLIMLIDTLYMFCNQERDLNISLSAISFFWSVSDHIRKLLGDMVSTDLPQPINNEEELLTVANSGEKPSNLHGLWMVSLLRLSKIARNQRPEIRNGAVKTLFPVFEAHGSSLTRNVWKTCNDVLFPCIMEIRTPRKGQATNPEDAVQWTETMTIILEGFGNMYANFMGIFIDEDYFVGLWSKLLGYFKGLVYPDTPKVSLSVYRALDKILGTFVKSKEENGNALKLPNGSLEETWDFWTAQEIDHNKVTDAKITQESLTALVELHVPLYKLTDRVSEGNDEKTCQLLRKCGSFPILPQFYSDREHLSPLQTAVFKRIKNFALSNNHITSLVLDLLSHFITLPFQHHTAPKIELEGSKEPTFVSISYNSLEYLASCLHSVPSYEDLCSNGTLKSVFVSLLAVMEAKFNCPLIQGRSQADAPLQLWQKASNIFLELVRIVHTILTKESELWSLILRGAVCLIYTIPDSPLQANKDYEDFDIETFKSLMAVLSPTLSTIPAFFWEELVKTLFKYSFLYTTNRNNYTNTDKPNEVVKDLSTSDFEGSSAQPTPLPRQTLAYMCIDELARLNPGSAHDYLVLRSAVVLHQYISDNPLRGLTPMPKIQRNELKFLLNVLLQLEDRCALQNLFPLISRAVSVAVKDQSTLSLLQHLLIKINN